MKTLWILSLLGWVIPAHAMLSMEDVKFDVPSGWQLNQDARSEDTLLVGLSNGSDYLRFYVRDRSSFSLNQMMASGAQVLDDQSQVLVGALSWHRIETKYSSQDGSQSFVAGFHTEHNGHDYFGYARSTTREAARAMADRFLRGLMVRPIDARPERSLTGVGFYGKKYYFGFGDYLSGFMGNEVKYDIAHTHDIFTRDVGGNYVGHKLHGSHVGGSAIRQKWRELGSKMTKDDMYVQYSSGHGSHTGLMIGVRYDEIRDNALSYPAKEVIIFTMACYSGNLVSSFDRKKSEWQSWASQGRTLMVMASSKPHETSSTGPGTDGDESGGPNGSAGSAFGHALWKALIGYADGFNDGVKDGFISLGEIRDFSIWKTRRIGGHTPVVTGVYSDGLVMNRVPPKAFVDSLDVTSEGLSERELMERISELDEAFRVNRN